MSIPIEEVEKLKQPLMSYTFGGDPQEREYHNDLANKINKQIDELIERYKNES